MSRSRSEVFQRSRQLVARANVDQRLLPTEHVSGEENATLRRNAVAERVESASGGEVVDVSRAADGVAVDDQVSAVRRREDSSASSRSQLAHVEGAASLAAVTEVPAGDRAIAGHRKQLIPAGAESEVADDGPVALEDVKSEGGWGVEALEDWEEGAVAQRR